MTDLIIDIAEDVPDEAEEKLIQLGYSVANIVMQVVHTLSVEGKPHPLAVIKPVESPIITANHSPGTPQRIQLVGVVLPMELASEIKRTALELAQERKEAAEARGESDAIN